MLAKHALYQLSYGPLSGAPSLELSFESLFHPKVLVGPGRLELPTSRLSGVCSNQLSYRPKDSAKAYGRSQKLAIAAHTLISESSSCRAPAG